MSDEPVDQWELSDKDLKFYPHFDGYRSAEAAMAYANDPEKVAKHAFLPFLLTNKSWTRYADKGEKSKRKDRPIRYAARADAYIYSKYRHDLSIPYEKKLRDLGLQHSVIAYRRIPREDGDSGKCNIDFAKEAFEEIKAQGNCVVVALDISSFFDSLDHQLLKEKWCDLLSCDRLPADHYAVFKAITQYSVVDKLLAYERYEHYGVKRTDAAGNPIKGYTTPYKEMPTKLGTGSDFRRLIAGKGGNHRLSKNITSLMVSLKDLLYPTCSQTFI